MTDRTIAGYTLEHINPEPYDDHVSASQLTTFSTCPRKWWLKYVKGLRERYLGTALVIGSAMHTVLEAVYTRQMQDDLSPGEVGELVSANDGQLLDDLAGDAVRAKVRQIRDDDQRVDWQEPAHYRGGAENMSRITDEGRAADWLRYWARRWFDPVDGAECPTKVLAVEEPINIRITTPDGEELPAYLKGYVDLLAEYSGGRQAAEHKTSANQWRDRRAHREVQGALYHAATGLPVRYGVLIKRKGAPGSHKHAPSSRGSDAIVETTVVDYTEADTAFALDRLSATVELMTERPDLAARMSHAGGYSDPCALCGYFMECHQMAGRTVE